jgi:hypothetical protein
MEWWLALMFIGIAGFVLLMTIAYIKEALE